MQAHSRLVFALVSSMAAASGVRAAPDGFLDPTFGLGGLQTVSFDDGLALSEARGIAVLPDGRILLAGAVEKEIGSLGIGLARLRVDGQIDEGFGRPYYRPAGVGAAYIKDAALQPDGKLVVAGDGYDPGYRALVCRFLADGSVDTGFATSDNALDPGCRVLEGESYSSAMAVAIQRDGRIVVAGAIDSNDVNHGFVLRLDANGNYDGGFGDGGVSILLPASIHDTGLFDVAETPMGDLIAVGGAVVNGDASWQVFGLRGDDGGADTDFDTDGLKPIDFDMVEGGNDYAYAVSVLPDGRITIGGVAGGNPGHCPAIARLMADGAFDPSLGGGLLESDGLHVDPFCSYGSDGVSDMLVQSDGRVVLAGKDGGDVFAMRFAPEGGRDTGFGANGLMYLNFASLTGVDGDDVAYRVANHAGRLLLVGGTYYVADVERIDFALARLDNDLIFTDGLE